VVRWFLKFDHQSVYDMIMTGCVVLVMLSCHY